MVWDANAKPCGRESGELAKQECRSRSRKFQLFRKIGLKILEQPIGSGVMFKLNFKVVC